MAIIKGWGFSEKNGFSGSTGKSVEVRGYRRGGAVRRDADGDCDGDAYRKGGPVKYGKDMDKDRGDSAAPVNELAKGGRPHIHVKKGALHKDMGIPQGQKIPRSAIRSKLARDKADHNVKGERRDVFALNFGKKHAEGGHIKPHKTDPDPGAKGGPDLDVSFPGNHLAYKKGGHLKPHTLQGHTHFPDHPAGHEHMGHRLYKAAGGGVQKKAGGGMMLQRRPMGMPRAPVVGMKRTRHPMGMPGASAAMPNVPGLPSPGTAPMGVPGAPGSPPRVMKRGGKS